MKETNKIPYRNEIDSKDKWQLEHLFQSDDLWESTYQQAQNEIPTLQALKGTLGQSGEQLLAFFQQNHQLTEIIDRLYVYANMRFHEDSTNSFYQTMSNKAEMLTVSFYAATAFIIPEILSIPENKLLEFISKTKGLSIYKHFIENILRQKTHALSEKEEELLARADDLASAAHNIFVMINDADISFPDIKNEKGEMVQLTKGRYTSFLEKEDRSVRQAAFQTLYDTYLKQKNTLAATYYASVKKDVFYAMVRHYPSAMAAALEDDNIPISVYTTLIDTVHEYLPLLHQYVDLRKKLLGVEELHMYDLYAPLVADLAVDIPYKEAKKTVLEGLRPLGEQYIKTLKKGFDGGWIDIYENVGKRGGAYSWGCYPGHPYVLLNHNNTINSMFTIAHEMGHALHSYYTWEKQPYIYSGHKIFVAEVASTVNEALLMEHLIKTSSDGKMKKYLVNYFMEQFRGTFFRQTMFAEFEKITHEMVERGEPLTVENLNSVYYNLNKLYFGNHIVVDDSIAIEWARIPHFYNAFYVYQYATGYSAAIALSRKILKEGTTAVARYLDFLSKGNSEYSIDLLKGAGVDMTTADPLKDAINVFADLLQQMNQFTV